MGNVWLKIKLWSKVIVFGLIGLYVILFVTVNWDKRVNGELNFIFTQFHAPRVLAVLAVTAVVSIVGWWLLRTVFKTIRQFRDARERGRTARIEKEIAEMRLKADMLQKREAPPAEPTV